MTVPSIWEYKTSKNKWKSSLIGKKYRQNVKRSLNNKDYHNHTLNRHCHNSNIARKCTTSPNMCKNLNHKRRSTHKRFIKRSAVNAYDIGISDKTLNHNASDSYNHTYNYNYKNQQSPKLSKNKRRRVARLNSKRKKTYAKNNWMSFDKYYHLEKPKISQKISNTKKIEHDGDDQFLPTWKLKLITNKIAQLHLKLLLPSPPNYVIKSDSINVDCQLLGEKYTSITMTIENEKEDENIPEWFRMFRSRTIIWKVLHILCRFEFTKCINHKINYNNFITGKKLINDTYKKLRRKCDFENCTKTSEDNMFSYYMNQHVHEHDDKDDKDKLKFTLTFKLHVPGIKRLITNYRNNFDNSIFRTISWLNFHFGTIFRCSIHKNYSPKMLNVFSRLIDNMDIDLKDKHFEINYKCRNIFIGLNKLLIYFKRIDNIIIDMLENDYNYGHFALVFMDILYDYLALNPINEQTISYRKTQLNGGAPSKNIKNFFQNNSVNSINCQSMTVNKFIGFDINDWCVREWLIADETEFSDSSSHSSMYWKNCDYFSTFYCDTCNVSNTFDGYNVLSNSWHDYSSYLNELISVLEQQQQQQQQQIGLGNDNHVMHQRCMTNRQLLFNMLVLQTIKNEDKTYFDDDIGDDEEDDAVYFYDQNFAYDKRGNIVHEFEYYYRSP